MRSEGASERLDADAEYAEAVRNYESAVLHLHKQHYDKARWILEKLIRQGPAGVADRARVHLRLCIQRMHPSAKTLKTTEDFYVAGVSNLNARRLERAIEYLGRAEKLAPQRAEIHYALASAYALRGDAELALERLQRAIQLDPQTRIHARRDEDFRSMALEPRFERLVNPARSVAAGGI